MKKTLILFAFLGSINQLTAQKNFDWKKIDEKNDGYEFNQFYRYSNNEYQAAFTISGKKNETKNTSNVIIRTYNDDFSKFTEGSVPTDSPREFSIKCFNNYTVFYGSSDDNNAPVGAARYKKDNQVLFCDAFLHPIKNELFSLHKTKRNFDGIPSALLSSDSNYLIIVNREVLNPMAPKEVKSLKHYISVYDKSLQLIWNDSVNFLEILKQKTEPDDISFDFLNGKLYIIGSNYGIPPQNIKPDLFVLQYDKPQSFKIILDQTFKHNSLGWKYLITKDGFMIINGINVAYNSPYVNGILNQVGASSNPDKALFFAKLKLYSQDSEPLFINTEINKQFLEKYPDYGSNLSEMISFPTDILLVNDGVIFCSEYHELISERSNNITTTTVHNKAITLIKYDLSGNVLWIKMIDKHIFSVNIFEGYYCRPFIVNNDVVIFYYDIEKNIFSDKLKFPFFALDNKYCLATARINPKGEIKKTLIYKVGDNNDIISFLPYLKQVDDNRFFMLGLELKTKVVTFGNTQPLKKFNGGYVGIFSLTN